MASEYRPHLEPRELTILELMNRGLSNAEIAERLGRTKGSAAACVGRILIKFGGGGRHAVVARARAWDIVTVPKGGGLKMPRHTPPRSAHLTRRERQVLELMNRGVTGSDIARELGANWETTRHHVGHIIAKLGGGTTFEIVTIRATTRSRKAARKSWSCEARFRSFRRSAADAA